MSESATPSQSLIRFYSDHHSWLRGWLRRRLNCSEQAADLAQDTFVKLLGKPLDIREPRNYLTAIARGLMVDRFRRQAIEAAYLEALAAQPEPATIELETQAIIIETLVAVDRLLDQLGSRTRAVFLLAQLEGMTQVDIGQRLKLSLPTVRRHLVLAYTECLLLTTAER